MAGSNPKLQDKISRLPGDPGIYKFFNREGTLIYVGKAKDLKKRVASYFSKNYYADRKTKKLVSEISDVKFAVVNAEYDALLLENNLIKTHQPKYNILLKDDKSFPFILVTNERFPRIYSTRRVNYKKGTYYGPYTSVKAMNNVLELIRSLYTIRTCKLNLSEEKIASGKYKVCLEYHIGNCQGPCVGLQTEADYLNDIGQATEILKGNLSPVKSYFSSAMEEASAKMNFELAQKFKEKLELLERFHARAMIVNQKISDVDVFSIVSDDQKAFVNYMKIKDGAVVLTHVTEVRKKLQESDADILGVVLLSNREQFKSSSREIITNVALELELAGLDIHVPKIGDKRKLVEVSLKNAYMVKREKDLSKASLSEQKFKILQLLQADLQLPRLPRHIECFDNSNLQGTNPVSSMVFFQDGKPSKNDYRKFHVKSVSGPDDFASMKEVVGRRYRRLQQEALPLPDLIIIDGGKGQLSAAMEALRELHLQDEIPIIGIAKRLEEIYKPGDSFPIHLSKKSPSLKLLQYIRDEAHRFAITFHRATRSKATFRSNLEQIEGVGKKTTDTLLRHFKSLKKIQEASKEELEAVIGNQKANVVFKALQE